MKHIIIDENLRGKALYKFLIENKAALIAQKKALPKCADAFACSVSFFDTKAGAKTKTAIGDIPKDATVLPVKVVANASNWCDSQMDVLIPDCWAKSIKEGKGRIHLADHTYKLQAQVGDVTDIYSQDIQLSELGLHKPGSTQCLIYESDVMKSYNEFIFNQYKAGKINQHSIGLQYVKLELAINEPEYEKEMDFWNKYINQVINRDMVEEKGYFWVVSEIKLLENSCVLFGANELTPTLTAGKMSTEDEPSKGTQEQPLKTFDLWAAIKQTTFLN